MMKLHRTLLIAAGLATATLFAGAARADCSDDVSVKGHGTAAGSGVTKHFNFEAKQRSSITLAAKAITPSSASSSGRAREPRPATRARRSTCS